MTTKAKSSAAAVIVAAALVTAGLLYFRGSWTCKDGAWTKTGHPFGSKPTSVCETHEAKKPAPVVCSPAWSCGHLSRGEAGMKPGTWYLKYDDVTGPAMLEIAFTETAVCTVDGVAAPCAQMNPPSGSSSSFAGVKDGETFRVSKLDFSVKK